MTQKLLQYKLDNLQLVSRRPSFSAPAVDPATPPTRQVSPGTQPDLQASPDKSGQDNAVTPGVVSQPSANKLCPACGTSLLPDQAVCLSCGAILGVAYASQTHRLEKSYTPPDSRSRSKGEVALGKRQLILEIDGASLILPRAEVVVIGRGKMTPASDDVTMVGLDDFGAEAKGVSRRHLKVVRREDFVYVADLGSTNGTWINRHRILPNRERLLRENDEIHLGQLRVKIQFRNAPVDNAVG